MPPKSQKKKEIQEDVRPRTRAQKIQVANASGKRRKFEDTDPFRPHLIDESSDEDLGPPLMITPLDDMSASSSFVPPVKWSFQPKSQSQDESVSPDRVVPEFLVHGEDRISEEIVELSEESQEESPVQSPSAMKRSKAKGKSKAKVKSKSTKKRKASTSNTASPVVEELSESLDEEKDNGLPPLPEIKVNLSDSEHLAYKGSDRKAACQFSQSLLEEAYPGFWDPQVTPFSKRFMFKEGKAKYKQLRLRTFFEERTVLPSHDQNTDLLRLIRRGKLMETVQNMEQYSKEVVLEFYSNFYPECELAPDICYVYLRGKFYEFSPRMINHVLDLPNHPYQAKKLFEVGVSSHVLIELLTDGKKTFWKGFEPKYLIPGLNSLYSICCLNWMPSSNSTYVTENRAKLCYQIWKRLDFNLGKIIYDQIAKIALKPKFGAGKRKKLLPFPSLITKVLEFQRSIPLKNSDYKEPGLKEFKVESRSNHEDLPEAAPSEHKLGVSMEADFNHVMSILNTMAQHYAG